MSASMCCWCTCSLTCNCLLIAEGSIGLAGVPRAVFACCGSGLLCCVLVVIVIDQSSTDD